MSIVCALRLNQRDALVAADTLYSENNRAVKYEGKIFDIGGYVVSFCGNLTVRDPIIKELRASVEEDTPQSVEGLIKRLKKLYQTERRRSFVEGAAGMEGEYTFNEYKKGKMPENRRQDLERYYHNPESFEGVFLVAGHNRRTGTLEIHELQFPGKSNDTGYYAVIGPKKSIESVREATREIQSRTREVHSIDGQEIGLVHGLRTVLSGVEKGWPERGVGGKTQLVMKKDGDVKGFGYPHTTFMHNLLELERRGDLEPSYVSDALVKVLEHPSDITELDKIASDAVATFLGSTEGERQKLTSLMKETVWIGDQFRH